jgi:hypothetical protein
MAMTFSVPRSESPDPNAGDGEISEGSSYAQDSDDSDATTYRRKRVGTATAIRCDVDSKPKIKKELEGRRAETSNGSSSRNAQVKTYYRNHVDTATTISDDKPKIKKEWRRKVSVLPVFPVKYLLSLLPIKK